MPLFLGLYTAVPLFVSGVRSEVFVPNLATAALHEPWRTAQPNRVRAWIFPLPRKLSRHAPKLSLQMLRTEPLRQDLLSRLWHLGRAPPLIPLR